MTLPVHPGTLRTGDELPAAHLSLEASRTSSRDRPGGTGADTIEERTTQGAATKETFPPCLVNLLIDTDHPHHFSITAARLQTIEGAPGSCLDAFKTHVRDTVGTDAYLRALGSLDGKALLAMMERALLAQGHAPASAAQAAVPLAHMASSAGLILLQDRIAHAVLGKLQAHDAVASLLLGDGALRGLLLARASEVEGEDARIELLQGFGLKPGEAAKVSGLLAPWIPDEIESPTSQSAEDVAMAHGILVKGLSRVHETVEALVPEIRHWQVGKELDLVADLVPEVKEAFMDLGLTPPGKGASVLHAAVASHLKEVEAERALESGVRLVIEMAASLAGPAGGQVASLAGILEDKKRLDDLILLQGTGSASAGAVDDAAMSVLAGLAGLAVDAF